MLATGSSCWGALAPPTAHVLDLGGGTGALSAAVLEGLPQARVTLLDVDAAMLEEARGAAPFGDRVESARAPSSIRCPPPTPSWPRWRSTTSTTWA